MHTLDQFLARLVLEKSVTREEAAMKAKDRNEFERLADERK
jgi:Tfp pilus assembly pilus retraction ATPase PilT